MESLLGSNSTASGRLVASEIFALGAARELVE